MTGSPCLARAASRAVSGCGCVCVRGGGGGGERPLGPCGDGHKAPREVTGHNMSSSQQLILPRSVGMAGGDVRSE